ncbi:MAG TPA: SUMF1/EgtB/PvdO family nonheme iron enzyme [Kofleriaceae bacterium]|nr:SUMF1/EgtB/PvdO family nonheme iron enzyme [Kofleriaceae bacterium]
MRNTIVLVLALAACGGEDMEPGVTPDAGMQISQLPDAAVPTGRCPPGMVWISSTTCVDAKEATVNDYLKFINGLGAACTDPGPTCTACGGRRCFTSNSSNPWHHDSTGWYIDGSVGMSLQHPARYVTYAGAKSACAAAGKRLCKAEEWTRSCGGGLKYPYGNAYESGRCNSASGITGSPWAVGSHANCASASTPQLVDMSGNVWEWTNDCSGDECQVRGGSFHVDGSFFPTALSCEGTQGWDQADETFGTDYDIGYRCCSAPI